MKPILYLFLTASLLSACVPGQPFTDTNPYRIAEGGRPWVIAHGGAKALFPENTLLAFEGAWAIGVDALEIDLQLTRDGVLICHHDDDIDGMSDGTGLLLDLDYADLAPYNFGHDFQALDGSYPYRDTLIPAPQLEEVLQRFPDAQFIVELKNRGESGRKAAEVLRNLIARYDLYDRIIVASFHDETLDYFREQTNDQVLLSSAESETEDFVFSGLSGMEFLYRPGAVAVQIPTSSAGINLASSRIVASAHRRDMAVHYWTINDKEEMRNLIGLGADGLITDRPDLMWEVLREMGF
ncbi:MAG: glycerophosphodiester phosphodiesterase [Bacteroidia bacterium]